MFAVIKKFEMSSKSFPTRYKDSPFFKTDLDSFDRGDDNKQNNNSAQSVEAMRDMEEENGHQNVIYSELFQKQWPKKNSFRFMQAFIQTNKRSYLHS